MSPHHSRFLTCESPVLQHPITGADSSVFCSIVIGDFSKCQMIMAYISDEGLRSHEVDLERLLTVDPNDSAGVLKDCS